MTSKAKPSSGKLDGGKIKSEAGSVDGGKIKSEAGSVDGPSSDKLVGGKIKSEAGSVDGGKIKSETGSVDGPSSVSAELVKSEPKLLDIEELHRIACEKGELFYEDPVSGLMVMTKVALLKNGKCCGRGCRHCPYGHVNVPKNRKKN